MDVQNGLRGNKYLYLKIFIYIIVGQIMMKTGTKSVKKINKE